MKQTSGEKDRRPTRKGTEMNNIQKALDLIGTFASGDAKLAAKLLDEGYIQHNLAYSTGRDAFVGSVEYLASAPVKTTVRNVRAFEDGDKVFLQSIYNFAGSGEQVAFDIFRFNGEGLIAEHWDNLADVAEPNPSGRTQIDGTTEVSELDKTEENRSLIKAFLEDVMQGKHPEKPQSTSRVTPISSTTLESPTGSPAWGLLSRHSPRTASR